MKHYKVSIDNGEYRKASESELPLAIRECIEKLIESGSDSGIVDIPGFRCEFSVCPEQYFPEDMIDTIHHVCAQLRTVAETLSEIDTVQFRQTIAVLRSSASRLTAVVKKEHQRNEVLNGDRLELVKDTIRKGQKLRDELNEASENESELIDENPNLCHFHQNHDLTYNPQYLNPDCPVCEREIDRRNNDCPNCRDY